MQRKFLVGLLLVLLAGVLWFGFTVMAVIIFDSLHWCVTTCWYYSGELAAIAIIVPPLLSLFFTRLAHVSLMSKTKAKNLIDEGNINKVKHKKSNV